MALPTNADRALEISLDGSPLPGPWRTKSGGRITAPDDRVHPGHMQGAISLGGTPGIENITVTALYDYARWHELSFQLESRVGPGHAVITELFLDQQRKVFGRGRTRTATLIGMQEPEYDAEAGNEPAALELEFSVDGP